MKRIYFVIAGLVGIMACNKHLSVETPNLSISINPSSSTAFVNTIADTFVYKLGDTTKFLFAGSTGNLMVYTGDATHNYDYKDRKAVLGNTTLSFSSAITNTGQLNTLSLLATNKLNGLDSTSIVGANWTDITNRANLATSATATASGNINLNDLVSSPNDSLFVALKYTGVTGTLQPTWTITNFTVNNILPDVTYNLTSLTDALVFSKLRVAPSTSPIWVASTSSLSITGGAATNPNNTGWIVTKPLYVGRVTPDVSIPLININSYTNNATATGYNYKYAAVGTYKVVFIIFNNTSNDQRTQMKVFYVKVQ